MQNELRTTGDAPEKFNPSRTTDMNTRSVAKLKPLTAIINQYWFCDVKFTLSIWHPLKCTFSGYGGILKKISHGYSGL